MERLQLGVQFRNILEIRGDWFIDEVICNDYRLISIILCYPLPNVTEELLRSLAFKEPRVAVAVIDIVSCLSSWSIMHIEDDIKTMCAAPADHVIKPLEAVLISCQSHIILISEELIMERHTNSVRSSRCNKLDILFSHVIVLEHLPELCSKVRSDHLLEHLVDHPCRVCLLEAEHVSLRIEPVTEICTLDEESVAIRLDQILAAYTDERFLWKVLLLRCA